MAGETQITVIGNLTQDVELRFTPSGSAVGSFTIASTPSSFDKATNAFKDGETLFMRCSIWREAAENAVESLTKGTRVIAQGRLKQRSYEKDGQTRQVVEMEVDELGPSLKFASAKVTRTQRSGGGNGGGFGQQGNGQGFGGGGQGADGQVYGGFNSSPQPGANNPNAGGWGNPGADEPPF